MAEWTSFSREDYERIIPTLAHFSAKHHNTSIQALGLRLVPENTLSLPYLSARTLAAKGIYLPLDYTSFRSKTEKNLRTVCLQVNAVIQKTVLAEQAPPEEVAVIEEILAKVKQTSGLPDDAVLDHRLRQILIKKSNADGGYIALTPMTASGLCELLLNGKTGLLPGHNAKVKRERGKNTPGHYLAQVHFPLAGSKPFIASCFRDYPLRNPVYLRAPREIVTLEMANRYFHKGPNLNFNTPGVLRSAFERYLAYKNGRVLMGMLFPEPERELESIRGIARAVLGVANEALRHIRDHLETILKRPVMEDNPPLCSSELPKHIQGLLDCRLREVTWPAAMADDILSRLRRVRDGNRKRLLKLQGDNLEAFRKALEGAFS